MELTTDWMRKAAKAVGVTALAPAVLLGAAVLLAAGAGFGGLSSLGQVAAGPPIPSVEQSGPTSSGGRSTSPAQAPVAALAPAATAAASGASPAAPARGGGGAGTQVDSNAPVTQPQGPANTSPGTRTPTRAPTPGSPSTPQSGSSPSTPNQSAPSIPQAPVTPQTPQLPSPPDPVQQLLDIPKALPAPVGPLSGQLLDGVTRGLRR